MNPEFAAMFSEFKEGLLLFELLENKVWEKSKDSIGLSNYKIKPGDTLFVPSILDRRTVMSMFVQGAKDWTTILYQFAIGAAAFKTLKN